MFLLARQHMEWFYQQRRRNLGQFPIPKMRRNNNGSFAAFERVHIPFLMIPLNAAFKILLIHFRKTQYFHCGLN